MCMYYCNKALPVIGPRLQKVVIDLLEIMRCDWVASLNMRFGAKVLPAGHI